jgi:hypothetical protein
MVETDIIAIMAASRIVENEWLLFNANSAIFQLYHGENKIIVNEMMMMSSALY